MTTARQAQLMLLAVTLVIAVGWFMLSRNVFGTAPVQAMSEAIGAGLGGLLVISIVGALRRNR